MPNSWSQERHWRNTESGSVLVMALLLSWLFLTAFLATCWLVRSTQQRIAMQSRLDICAVKLAKNRENLLQELSSLNKPLRLTIWGVYAARGVKLLGPLGAGFGSLGEFSLLQLNRTLSLAQETKILAAQAKELPLLACAATPYSQQQAGCLILPKAAMAFQREKTLFPDLRGTLLHKKISTNLAKIRCASWKQQSVLQITGDPLLQNTKFMDRYEK